MSDDEETNVSLDQTDAGNPAPAPFRGSHLDQAGQAAAEYERRKSEGESFGGAEADPRIDLAELGDHPDKW